MHRDRRDRGAPIAVLALSILALVLPATTFAADGGLKLALAAVGQDGPYFDLRLRPGDSIGLEVDIANDGASTVAARTYVADVFTITNGGYGGRLRDEAQTGTTTWVGYPTAVLDLSPGEHVRRSLTVAVPMDTVPGEYITSLVLENESALRSDGDVAFDQIVRQAIAVVITIPGERTPGLELGEARYSSIGARSIVSISVENSGNVRLRPTIDFALTDSEGNPVHHASFQMDTVYARTDTHVEVGLATLLPPGRYWVRLSLEDIAQGIVVTDEAIPFEVAATPGPTVSNGMVPGPEGVVQGPPWLAALVVALAVALIAACVIIGLLVIVMRRHTDPTGAD